MNDIPPTSAAPAVSVIVLAHQRREAVELVLDRLRDEPVHEVIVVDSGSTDGTAAMVRARPEPHVRLLDAGGNVAIAGRNRGVEQATGELLLMLDDDSYPAPGAIDLLRERFVAQPDLGVLGGWILDTSWDGEILLSDELGTFDWWLRAGEEGPAPPEGFPTFFFPEGGCMVRRDAFLEVDGFFEPYFFATAEVDLATRMLGAGWDVRYLPTARFHHLRMSSTTPSTMSLQYRVRNQLWYFARHFSAPVAVVRAVAYLLFDLVECAVHGELGAWRDGIVEAWQHRDRIRGTRRPLPSHVRRRAEMNRGRLHVRLLVGQLARRLGLRRAGA